MFWVRCFLNAHLSINSLLQKFEKKKKEKVVFSISSKSEEGGV